MIVNFLNLLFFLFSCASDVDDAGVFRGDNTNICYYGGNLIIGDELTVEMDTVRITNISGNTITVDSSFTWANNENVYFSDDFSPAIGAYPYKSGGYTLQLPIQNLPERSKQTFI